MVILISAIGFKQYFENKFNVFDFFVVGISTLDIVLQNLNNVSAQGLSFVRALRTFRILRLFKLVRVWKNLHRLLGIIGKTLKKIFYLALIVVLFLFVFALLGHKLFAFRIGFDSENKPVPNYFDSATGKTKIGGYSPDFNFDSYTQSLIAVFIFIAFDGWTGVFYNAMRSPDIS